MTCNRSSISRRRWVALFLTVLFLAPTPRAHALVGGAMSLFGGAGLPVVAAGGIVAASGLGLAGVSFVGINLKGCSSSPPECWGAWFVTFVLGGLTAAIGSVIMENDEGLPILQFTELDASAESTLELTQDEADAYREKLSEINLAAESVQAELATELRPGKIGKREAKKLADRLEARSKALWLEAKPVIGDEAFAAMAKVVAGAASAPATP